MTDCFVGGVDIFDQPEIRVNRIRDNESQLYCDITQITPFLYQDNN